MQVGAFRRLGSVVLQCCLRWQVLRRAHRLVLVAVLAVLSTASAASLPAEARDGASPAAKSKPSRAAVRAARVERTRASAADPKRLGPEIVSLRTRTSRTFVGRNGGRVTRVSPESLHVRDSRGAWQPIDSRLVRSGGRLLNRRGRYSTSLPLRLGQAPVRVRKGARWVDFRLRDADAPARVRGAVAHYENALPGVDVEYEARADYVKETLVLAAATARRRYVFDLAMSRGLRPRLLRSNGMVLVDRRGRARLSVGAPFMFDAKGRRSPRVVFDLDNVGGRWRLAMTPSARWLERKSRAWPVTVDPVFYADPDRDCMLDAAAAETSQCGGSVLAVGTSGSVERTSLVRFDLSAVPANAEVLYSSLEMHKNGTGSGDMQILAHPAAEAWTGSASWNRVDGTDRWGEPGGEYDSDVKAAYNDSISFTCGCSTDYGWWEVHNIVREWIKGRRGNHGFLLRRNPATSGYAEFHSTEAAALNGANRAPLLDVEWVQRPGMRRGYKYETQRLTDRISLSVNAGTGNLLVRQSDFSMPGGLGPDVAVSRTYNSVQGEDGAFGRGWTLDSPGQDVRARYSTGAGVRYFGPSGVRVLYEPKNGSSTEFVTPPGFDNTMTRNASTREITLTDNPSQTKHVFDSSGRLLRVEDRNGRKLTPVYDATNSHVARVESAHTVQTSAGDEVRFTHTSATKLTQMTDPDGRVHSYGYDASNRLISYTDPQNGSSFKTLYEYGGPGGQLSKITTPQGNITTIAYYPDGHEDARKVKTVTRVTDTTAMTGPTTTFAYYLEPDGTGATRVTDPIGTATSDANDRVTRYQFDSQARVTNVRDALGRETSHKLTSTSKVESYTAASNSGTTPNTSFGFDGDDNQKSSTTPAGAGGVLGCADFGTPDPSTGSEAEKQCDAPAGTYNGVPSTVKGSQYLPGRATNPQGGRTNFSWTAEGNPSTVQQTDNSGSTMTSGVSFSYGSGVDGLPGRLNSITDHRGNTTSYGYTDGKGNVNTITPPNPGAPNPTGVTTLEYNTNLARVSRVIMPNETAGVRQRRNLTYDSSDRLTRIDFTGTNDTLDGCEPYVLSTYDRDGNLTAEESREQGTCTIRTRSMTYDKLNRVTFESLPGGASNTYAYDLVGNLRSLTDAGGKVEYTYNAANEQRAVYEPGVASPTKLEHTQDGQPSKTTYPNGVTIDQTYEPGSLRLLEIHAKNSAAATLQKFTYAYKDPSTSRETPLIFEKTDGVLGQATRYAYDPLDRLDTATIKSSSGDWASNATLAKYDYDLDAVGNITSRTVTGTQAPNSTTGYTYNSANELCQRQAGAPAASCPTSSPPYTYDRNGNQLTAPGRSASYNLLDQTTSISGTALIYLGTGQDRWITEGTGSFQHNVLGVGRRTVGTSTDYFTRDEGGRLISRRNGTARHYYLFDELGSITGLTDANAPATVSQRYDYEPYGTPAPSGPGQWGATGGAADVPQGQFGFAGGYRSVGGLYHFGQRYYDPSDMRWTQPDPLDQTGDLVEGNRYTYAAGDPVGLSDPSGEIIPAVVAGVATAARVAAPVVARAVASRVATSRTAYTATRTAVQRVGPTPRAVPGTSYRGRVAVHRHAGGPHQREHIQANWWREGMPGSGGVGRWFAP